MTDFQPGFLTREMARRAGAKFFASTTGMPGKEGRHFHLVQNSQGRWYFEEGREPKSSSGQGGR